MKTKIKNSKIKRQNSSADKKKTKKNQSALRVSNRFTINFPKIIFILFPKEGGEVGGGAGEKKHDFVATKSKTSD